jgi:hypothetical protein
MTRLRGIALALIVLEATAVPAVQPERAELDDIGRHERIHTSLPGILTRAVPTVDCV